MDPWRGPQIAGAPLALRLRRGVGTEIERPEVCARGHAQRA